MATNIKELKWDLKTAKSVAGRKNMSTKKKNEWKRRARLLEQQVAREQRKEDRKNRLRKHK